MIFVFLNAVVYLKSLQSVKNLRKKSLALLLEYYLTNDKKFGRKTAPTAFLQSKQYIFTITITDFSQISFGHTVFLKLIDHSRICVML